MMLQDTRIALTWGDCGENHAGNQQIGEIQKSGTGILMEDLEYIKAWYEKQDENNVAEMTTFSTPENCPLTEKAGVLILRNFLSNLETTALMEELVEKEWDSKFYNTRTKKVLNKHARENLLFMRGFSQDAVYEEGKGTIFDIDNMNILSDVDERVQYLSKMIEKTETKTKHVDLICEGNKYRTKARIKSLQQGIGWHGDAERTRVFALCVGGFNYPMKWCLFHRSAPVCEAECFELNSGDLYIMSELAVGQHWNKSSLWTWRHCAGHEKFTSLDRFTKAITNYGIWQEKEKIRIEKKKQKEFEKEEKQKKKKE